MAGIYMLWSKLCDEVYIGSSKNIKTRLYIHKYETNKCRDNSILYLKIREIGIDNFESDIIEEIEDLSKIKEREQYWLDHFKDLGVPLLNKNKANNNPNKREYDRLRYIRLKDKMKKSSRVNISIKRQKNILNSI